MKASKLLLMMTLVAVAATATAQVYKWKDAQGRMHYSDVPPGPAQGSSEVMNTRDIPVSSIATPKAPPITAKAPTTQASEVAQVQKDPRICEEAKARKSFLQTGQLTRTVNEKGEVEFLSDERRLSQIAEADKAIATHCP